MVFRAIALRGASRDRSDSAQSAKNFKFLNFVKQVDNMDLKFGAKAVQKQHAKFHSELAAIR